MTSRAAATRYARALFDVVIAEKLDPQATARELTGFTTLLAENDALGRVLTDPSIPMQKKRGVVEQLLTHGSLQAPVAKLLLLLADRDRLGLLPDLADAFQRRLMDHLKIVRAQLVTAIALPQDRVAALADGLARATGRQVQLETRVDTGILGGAVARIGSTVYDGSVTRQLEKMKEALTQGAE